MDTQAPMNILQINTADKGGGAEGSAFNLFTKFRELDQGSWLAVGTKYSNDPDVIEIPKECPPGLVNNAFFKLAQWARNKDKLNRTPQMRKIARILERLSNPDRMNEWRNGREEFDFPGCKKIMASIPVNPDIIHCHNLHGWYFDLRIIPELSRRKPLILNLRDTWLLTGHCAYFMDCAKWIGSCGRCPRLSTYPAIRKNATTDNWFRKQQIYNASTLYVTAPSQWLMDQVQMSMLQPRKGKVIPNGIDTSVFTPGSQAQARSSMGLPQDAKVVMFASASAKTIFKDPDTMAKCISILSFRIPELHFLCVGSQLPFHKKIPNLLCLPYISSPAKMADCYRAANVFIHTAKAEAFGKTITEAMACGTPVAATAVGGIPEQIINGETGFLAERENSYDLADKTQTILNLKPDAMENMKDASAKRGALFSLDNQARNFLEWYREIALDHAQLFSTSE